MKSNQSFFNKTVFKKNLTRFAPAWGLYTVGAMMGLILLVSDGSQWMADNLMGAVTVLCVITPLYAMLCAQLLFGDLYNTRMCNALHALPLLRETWFATNVLSGFAFHLIPTALLTVLVAPILAIYSPAGSALAAPIFLLATNLQYACFFGLAVFCALCVGSRFAQAVLFGIVNFSSIIAGWLIDTIFVPMYYGIQIDTEPFQLFSPTVIMGQYPFVNVHRTYAEQWEYSEQFYRVPTIESVSFQSDGVTVYYFVAAAIGIGLLFAAMQLYRRRKLECAGDFLTIRALEPVFLVVYSVIVGAVFHFCVNEIIGMETYLFLFLGLAVGWFTGKMPLERSPRVFGKKNFLRCGILLGVCGLTIVAALTDPFGIESWVPDAEKVKSVTVFDGNYRYSSNEVTLDSPEDITRIIAVHKAAQEEYWQDYPHEYNFEQAYNELIETTTAYIPGDMERYAYFTFSYELTGGRTVRRYYRVWLGDEHGEYLKQIFSSPEALFGYGEDLSRLLEENSRLSVRDTWEGNETVIRFQADITDLYQAILADCRAGNMAQKWSFHDSDESLFWIYFENGSDITVFSNCENTLNWLRSYGLDVDRIIEKYSE